MTIAYSGQLFFSLRPTTHHSGVAPAPLPPPPPSFSHLTLGFPLQISHLPLYSRYQIHPHSSITFMFALARQTHPVPPDPLPRPTLSKPHPNPRPGRSPPRHANPTLFPSLTLYRREIRRCDPDSDPLGEVPTRAFLRLAVRFPHSPAGACSRPPGGPVLIPIFPAKVRTGQVGPGQVRSGQGQARSRHVRSGKVRSGGARSVQVRSGQGQGRSRHVRSGEVRSGWTASSECQGVGSGQVGSGRVESVGPGRVAYSLKTLRGDFGNLKDISDLL